MEKFPKFIFILYFFLINIPDINAECGRDEPFKRTSDDSCSSNVCGQNENGCSIDNSIIKVQWLNNIFNFDEVSYAYGSIAFNDNGDMIIEYSYDNLRLFFCLKKNGNYQKK